MLAVCWESIPLNPMAGMQMMMSCRLDCRNNLVPIKYLKCNCEIYLESAKWSSHLMSLFHFQWKGFTQPKHATYQELDRDPGNVSVTHILHISVPPNLRTYVPCDMGSMSVIRLRQGQDASGESQEDAADGSSELSPRALHNTTTQSGQTFQSLKCSKILQWPHFLR